MLGDSQAKVADKPTSWFSECQSLGCYPKALIAVTGFLGEGLGFAG